jgi:hypothetical protein
LCSRRAQRRFSSSSSSGNGCRCGRARRRERIVTERVALQRVVVPTPRKGNGTWIRTASKVRWNKQKAR